jgi:hypothetical protein
MTWKASGKSDLALADREREWDGDAARERIFRWADWDGKPDTAKARAAFFAFDDDDPALKTNYKLPFADVIGGELKAVPRAVFAVAGVLEGARDGVDLPRDVKKAVRQRVAAYYGRMGDDPPWDDD